MSNHPNEPLVPVSAIGDQKPRGIRGDSLAGVLMHPVRLSPEDGSRPGPLGPYALTALSPLLWTTGESLGRGQVSPEALAGHGRSGFGVGTSMGVLAAAGRIAPWGPHVGPQKDHGSLLRTQDFKTPRSRKSLLSVR
jgi:hypothetical protein